MSTSKPKGAVTTAWQQFCRATAETAPVELPQPTFILSTALNHLAFDLGARTVLEEVFRILELEDDEDARSGLKDLADEVKSLSLEGQTLGAFALHARFTHSGGGSKQ